MLCLTRKIGERIIIDGTITLKVIDVQGSRVRLGIEAARDIRIEREEIVAPPSSTVPEISTLP